MKKEEQDRKAKGPGNEDYDVNHPQNITKPSFRSDSDYRNSGNKPTTENLNLENDDNEQLKAQSSGSDQAAEPRNDDQLHGDSAKTDLGNSQNKDDDKEDEQLIRK